MRTEPLLPKRLHSAKYNDQKGQPYCQCERHRQLIPPILDESQGKSNVNVNINVKSELWMEKCIRMSICLMKKVHVTLLIILCTVHAWFVQLMQNISLDDNHGIINAFAVEMTQLESTATLCLMPPQRQSFRYPWCSTAARGTASLYIYTVYIYI